VATTLSSSKLVVLQQLEMNNSNEFLSFGNSFNLGINPLSKTLRNDSVWASEWVSNLNPF